MRVRASHECLKKELWIPHDDNDGRGMVRGCVLVTCCVCQVMQARLLYGLYHDGHDDRTHLAMEEERASGHHRPTRHSGFSVSSPRVSGSMDMEGKPSSSITKKKSNLESHLEGTEETVAHGHYGGRVVKLAAIVRRREDRDELTIREKFVSVLDDLVFCFFYRNGD